MSRFETGQVIAERYRVVQRLGAGAFGAVYLVDDLHWRGKRFALKVLQLGFDAEKDAARLQRFRDEADRLLDLVHPSIVQIRNYVEFEGMCCFAMDHVEGRTVKELLEEGGPLSVERALLRTREVLSALAAAHEQEPPLIHRDIKSENVMLSRIGTARERARVLDFGIAKELQATGTGLTGDGAIGTPAYMSPEQGRGKKGQVDARSDIYSTGCMLFELLTGRLPFESESVVGFVVQHELEPVPALRDANPDVSVPVGVEGLVRTALEKEPDDRFRSAREMIAAIDALGLVAADERVASGSDAFPASVVRDAMGTEGDPAAAAPSVAPAAVLGLPDTPPAALPRARIDLPAGGAAALGEAGEAPGGVRSLFVFTGSALRFGRARPGQQGDDRPENNLVLRVLPCRSQRLDPESFAATKRISATHGTIEAQGGVLWLTDTSSFGTSLDGARLMRGEPVALPPSFCLALAGTLTLEGRVLAAADAAAWPAALLLTRVGNYPHHAYLWVRGSVLLGADLPDAVPVPAGCGGRIEAAGEGGLRFYLSGGLEVRPSPIGAEVRLEEA